MKKIVLISIAALAVVACSKDDGKKKSNPAPIACTDEFYNNWVKISDLAKQGESKSTREEKGPIYRKMVEICLDHFEKYEAVQCSFEQNGQTTLVPAKYETVTEYQSGCPGLDKDLKEAGY